MLGQVFEILGKLQQFIVFVSVQVGLAERADSEAVFRVHYEIPPDVVEHDRVFGVVLLEFAPDHPQRFHLQILQYNLGATRIVGLFTSITPYLGVCTEIMAQESK